MVKRKLAFQKKKQNRFSMFLVSIAIVMLLLVVSVKEIELKNKQEEYLAKAAALELQIEQEEKRAAELVELEKYTKTKKYVEEIAKDKLGLVHDGEIIFKPEN